MFQATIIYFCSIVALELCTYTLILELDKQREASALPKSRTGAWHIFCQKQYMLPDPPKQPTRSLTILHMMALLGDTTKCHTSQWLFRIFLQCVSESLETSWCFYTNILNIVIAFLSCICASVLFIILTPNKLVDVD